MFSLSENIEEIIIYSLTENIGKITLSSLIENCMLPYIAENIGELHYVFPWKLYVKITLHAKKTL